MKQLIIFLCGLLMSFSAYSQTSAVYSEVNPFDINSTIVKEVKYPATITCHNTVEKNVQFVYVDASLSTKEFILDYNELVVHDMEVLSQDTVVFCGEAIINGQRNAVVGFFKISDILTSSVNVRIQKNFVSGENVLSVVTLTRMVTYLSSNMVRHIVCIGSCFDIDEFNNVVFYPCIVDISGYDIGTSGYISGCVENVNETFEDIDIATAGVWNTPYVVTVGFDMSYGRYMGFRIYNPDNIFSSPNNIEDTLRLLRVDPSGTRKWLDDGLSLSRISNGSVATVSYRKSDNGTSDQNANIHIGKYSVMRMWNGALNIMEQSQEIPFTPTSNRKMRDLIYSSKTKGLVFLHTAKDLSTLELKTYYCEIPENYLLSPSPLNVFYYPDYELHRLSLYNNAANYLWCGVNTSLPFVSANGMFTFGLINRCSEREVYNPVKKDCLTISKKKRPFTEIGGMNFLSVQDGEIDESVINLQCEVK